MKHFPFLLSLAAGLGTACILGGFSAAADSAGVTVPVATETTQPSGNWGVTESGSRCYYDAQGECVTGEVTIDGTDYLFDYTGAQKTGWRTVNGIRRYYDPVTGEPVSGWVESGGHRYYADSDTGKLTGEQTLESKEYILNGTVIVADGGRLNIPAGTTIKAREGFSSYLLVAQGGKLYADGTADKPVIFTANTTSPVSGYWGGIIINGKAPISGQNADCLLYTSPSPRD